MNIEKTIKHIQSSILNGEKEQSKITKDIKNITGFSSNKIRHFLNNLLELDNINYLEIGTFQGSTFCSALHGNNLNSAYAIDNWSKNQDFKNTREVFLENTKNYDFSFIEEDAFSIDLSKIPNPINLYLYDGDHTYDAHYKALEYYYEVFDDTFIVIIDDYDPYPGWEAVQQATQDVIKNLNLKKIYEQHIPSTGRNSKASWWNGYYIAILQKS